MRRATNHKHGGSTSVTALDELLSAEDAAAHRLEKANDDATHLADDAHRDIEAENERAAVALAAELAALSRDAAAERAAAVTSIAANARRVVQRYEETEAEPFAVQLVDSILRETVPRNGA